MSALSCTKCIFATQEGEVFGCRAGRLDKFLNLGKAEQNDDGSYQLKQFCNLYRPKKWLLTDEKIEDALERAEQQSKCSFGIVLEVNNKEDLKKYSEADAEELLTGFFLGEWVDGTFGQDTTITLSYQTIRTKSWNNRWMIECGCSWIANSEIYTAFWAIDGVLATLDATGKI